LPDVGLDLVLAHHAIDDDLKVQLAHTGDDGLARVRIGVDAEGWILLRELGQRHAHLLLVGLGLRFDCDRDDGLGEVDGLEDDRVLVGTDGVAGDEILEGRPRRRYRRRESR